MSTTPEWKPRYLQTENEEESHSSEFFLQSLANSGEAIDILREMDTVLGRRNLKGAHVSATHAVAMVLGGMMFVKDSGSRNGTFISWSLRENNRSKLPPNCFVQVFEGQYLFFADAVFAVRRRRLDDIEVVICDGDDGDGMATQIVGSSCEDGERRSEMDSGETQRVEAVDETEGLEAELDADDEDKVAPVVNDATKNGVYSSSECSTDAGSLYLSRREENCSEEGTDVAKDNPHNRDLDTTRSIVSPDEKTTDQWKASENHLDDEETDISDDELERMRSRKRNRPTSEVEKNVSQRNDGTGAASLEISTETVMRSHPERKRRKRKQESDVEEKSPSDIRVLCFSGVVVNGCMGRRVKGIGCTVTHDVDKCDALLADELRRTEKCFLALSMGKPILCVSFIDDAEELGYLPKMSNYFVGDTERVYESAQRKKVFSDCAFFIASNVLSPPKPVLTKIIRAADGVVVDSPNDEIKCSKYFIVADKNKGWDNNISNATVVDKEFVLSGVMHGRLEPI